MDLQAIQVFIATIKFLGEHELREILDDFLAYEPKSGKHLRQRGTSQKKAATGTSSER